MNIGILTSSYPRYAGDGAGTFVRSLAEAYVEEGHTVFAIAPYDPLAQDWDRCVTVRRFRYAPDRLSILGHARSLKADRDLKWYAPLLLPSYCAAAISMLAARHRHSALDWIHAQWLVPSGIIAAIFQRWCRVPYVVTLQGSDVFVAERNQLYARIARVALRQASLTVGVSTDLVQRALRLGLPPPRARTIPNGVNPQIFKPEICASQAAVTRLGLPSNAIPILCVGRLVYKKGHEVLLRAIRLIVQQQPDVVLLIAGDGDLQQSLRRHAVELGIERAVRFLGHVDWRDLPGVMNICELCVFPYIRDISGNVDGMPTAVVEAMACARSVVASDISGIAELIRHGNDGWLVPAGDATALADAINLLLNDKGLRLRLGVQARKRVEHDFSWRAIARKYLDFADSQGWAHA